MTEPGPRPDSDGPLPDFWAELRRRRVVRVAAVYGGTAFVVVQAASLFLPRMGLPDWTVTLVVWLALLGFPLALVLAWAFEVTPDGVRRTGPVARAGTTVEDGRHAAGRDRREVGRLAAVFAAGIVAAAAGYGLYAAWSPGGTPGAEAGAGSPNGAPAARGAGVGDAALAASVAVLPFEDLSATGDQAWFGDGVAEEILDKLGRVERLEVKARRSSFRFRGGELGIRSIADSLGVAAVLEGSVRRSGDRVRVTAQLVDGRTANHLWSESYERELSDIFAVQEEIARRVAGALEIELGGADRRRLAGRGTGDLEAYGLYLRGRHAWRDRFGERLFEAERLFRRALALDSTFAAAWAGLADTYLLMPDYAPDLVDRSRETLRAEAERAARRALSIDPTLSEAHASLGHVLMLRHRWEASASAFRRAVQLNPSYATASHWFAIHLAARGRLSEAVEQVNRGARLDPFNWALAVGQAALNAYAGRGERAAEALGRAASVLGEAGRSRDSSTQLVFHRVYIRRLTEGSAAARTLADSLLEPESDPHLEIVVRVATGERGPIREALRRAQEALPSWPAGAAQLLSAAAARALLGEVDRAFALVERAELDVIHLIDLQNDPALAPLRTDPRYADVLADYGLSP